MFGGPKTKTQTYDEALEVIAAGDAVIAGRWEIPTQTVKNQADFDHRLYTIFADVGPKNMQSFVCGPFGNWDGTSRGCFCDGFVFHLGRPSFIEALKHHRSDDGARYIWDFLLAYGGIHVLSPLYEKIPYHYVCWLDETETEYATQAEADEARSMGTGKWGSASSSYHIRRRQ